MVRTIYLAFIHTPQIVEYRLQHGECLAHKNQSQIIFNFVDNAASVEISRDAINMDTGRLRVELIHGVTWDKMRIAL